MNRSTYSNWKLGKSKSYLKRIEEIADFFGVTPDYLLTYDEQVETCVRCGNPTSYSINTLIEAR
jgi:transcriptional regulator with XRE-family HTH domain